MKRTIRNNLLLVIACLLFARLPAVAAQGPTVVTIAPAEAVLAAGETTTITIQVAGAEGVFGVELHLFYDPAVVEILDGDASREGIQVVQGSFLDPEKGFTVANRVDNLSGELDYAITLLAPVEAVSGNGRIVSFDVRALADGSSPLVLSAILASAEGESLPVTIEGGLVVVGAGAGNAPLPVTPSAPTPTPDQGESEHTPQTTTGKPTSTTEMHRATPEASQTSGTTGNNTSQETPTAAEMRTTESVESVSAELGARSVATEAASSAVALPFVSQDRQDAAATGDEVSGQNADRISPSDSNGPAESANDKTDNPLLTGGLVLVAFLLIASVIFFGRRLISRK